MRRIVAQLLCITILVQVLAVFTSYAWYLFAVVPAFATYKLGAWYFGSGSSKAEPPAPAASESAEKPKKGARARPVRGRA